MIALLLGVKVGAKLIGVWPVAAAFGIKRRERNYTTLLMATGLTFGSISALYGLTHHLITSGQPLPSELVTVVILSAFVPTLIAQQFFCRRSSAMRRRGARRGRHRCPAQAQLAGSVDATGPMSLEL